jgi:hypothetical protein
MSGDSAEEYGRSHFLSEWHGGLLPCTATFDMSQFDELLLTFFESLLLFSSSNDLGEII